MAIPPATPSPGPARPLPTPTPPTMSAPAGHESHHTPVSPPPPPPSSSSPPTPNRALARFRTQYATRQWRWSQAHIRPVPYSSLEALPVEIFTQILTYLTHPRSHLPGFTEAQSAHHVPAATKSTIKANEDLAQPSDVPDWAADLFSLHQLSHPFLALSLTSRRCHDFVEGYCAHLVRSCNSSMFNLPFAQLDQYGSHCVYPDLSSIVYRRLWLQHAPRTCVYCYAVLDCYPFLVVKRIMTACMSCFYRQTLTVDEVESQYHISAATITSSLSIRSIPGWVLRIDVETLALQLYRTRAFHNAHKEQFGKPCSLCAITRFLPELHVGKVRGQKGNVRQIAGMRKRSVRWGVRCLG